MDPTSPQRFRQGSREDPRHETFQDDEVIQRVLEPLDDPDCLAILDAIDEESLSAREIAEVCDLPLSTAYRKLELLADAGIVSQGVRLSTSGNHTSEYERLVDDVKLSVSPDGFTLRISRRDVDHR
ncbi:Transcriptional regulator containing HTH domain,ArsR family [Halalkaliarchaeum sp. AArc-CO]|uniref:winged helix-turn-helix domain-containing protein n=1 Tax=unclassified Halalkaliarchaeum TaxID=2678344 RepID=UPI00217CE885|nr:MULTISPECIES: helix-turn-helix domain-containing protein [unclassified Halalkaliarchaeum]MDR5673433.1 helix-turn-helix domain-containing protein [Halalkaliarchaeum sp. AArc-GB]UWG49892.1 Transcriptional regulator containing HTH domain,ArsR family [Halalkaliarchaeum sp. AArc-CO]